MDRQTGRVAGLEGRAGCGGGRCRVQRSGLSVQWHSLLVVDPTEPTDDPGRKMIDVMISMWARRYRCDPARRRVVEAFEAASA